VRELQTANKTGVSCLAYVRGWVERSREYQACRLPLLELILEAAIEAEPDLPARTQGWRAYFAAEEAKLRKYAEQIEARRAKLMPVAVPPRPLVLSPPVPPPVPTEEPRQRIRLQTELQTLQVEAMHRLRVLRQQRDEFEAREEWWQVKMVATRIAQLEEVICDPE
jgi:hypothetical protein